MQLSSRLGKAQANISVPTFLKQKVKSSLRLSHRDKAQRRKQILCPACKKSCQRNKKASEPQSLRPACKAGLIIGIRSIAYVMPIVLAQLAQEFPDRL